MHIICDQEAFEKAEAAMNRAIARSNRINKYWSCQSVLGSTSSWCSEDEYKGVVRMGWETMKQNPNSRYYALGQSPAWVVKAIEMLADETLQSCKTGYIPFSDELYGDPFDPNDTSNYVKPRHFEEASGVYRYEPLPADALKGENVEKYKGLLASIGLHPKEIARQYDNGTTTTIVELMKYGTGLSSFLQVLFDWAQQEDVHAPLTKAIKLQLYTSKFETGLSSPLAVHIPNAGLIGCSGGDKEWELMTTMWECQHRIVPEYPPKKWGNPPDAPEGNKVIVAESINRLRSAMNTMLVPVEVDASRRLPPRRRNGTQPA